MQPTTKPKKPAKPAAMAEHAASQLADHKDTPPTALDAILADTATAEDVLLFRKIAVENAFAWTHFDNSIAYRQTPYRHQALTLPEKITLHRKSDQAPEKLYHIDEICRELNDFWRQTWEKWADVIERETVARLAAVTCRDVDRIWPEEP